MGRVYGGERIGAENTQYNYNINSKYQSAKVEKPIIVENVNDTNVLNDLRVVSGIDATAYANNSATQITDTEVGGSCQIYKIQAFGSWAGAGGISISNYKIYLNDIEITDTIADSRTYAANTSGLIYETVEFDGTQLVSGENIISFSCDVNASTGVGTFTITLKVSLYII